MLIPQAERLPYTDFSSVPTTDAETHGRDAGSAPSPFVLPLTHTHRTTLLWVFVVSHGEQEGHTLPSAPSTTASFPPLTCLPSAPGSR